MRQHQNETPEHVRAEREAGAILLFICTPAACCFAALIAYALIGY